MKLTLRKANALQLLINEQIASTEIPTSANVSKYDDPTLLVIAVANTLDQGVKKKTSLLKVLYSLRKKAAEESHKAGIPEILADMAFMDKVSAVLEPLSKLKNFAPSEEVLKQAFEDLKREAPAAGYNRRDSFGTGVVPPGWVSAWVAELSSLRKQKQNLSDRLLELNVRHEIELDGDEELTLKLYDLI